MPLCGFLLVIGLGCSWKPTQGRQTVGFDWGFWLQAACSLRKGYLKSKTTFCVLTILLLIEPDKFGHGHIGSGDGGGHDLLHGAADGIVSVGMAAIHEQLE